MTRTFKTDFKNATKAYLKNKELIQSYFNGHLYSLELSDSELDNVFDRAASTDIIYETNKRLLYGIAMRVNFNTKHFNTITIRYARANGSKTEYEKSINAIKTNAINASIGIQIDVDEKMNMTKGVIYDRYNLISLIDCNIKWFIKNKLMTAYDGNTFFSIQYDELNTLEIRHKIMN
jgi:PDZ domain-containing secreted protein